MSKPHVLIVDDEKSIRLALETGLSLDGFSVSSARSGREAISAARSQKFDVVVCDIFMPDGDGLRPLAEMVRTYVGPEFDFDVQPVLRPEEVPWTRSRSRGDARSRLGWNTWVRRPPFTHAVAEPVFTLEDV